jgi:hypothetical protein
MAKKRKKQLTIPQSTNAFDKGLVTDLRDYHLDTQSITNARNAINNTHIGDLGEMGNEPANLFCTAAPYTIIGVIHLTNSQWVLFSTDNVNSEIGTFDEEKCTYEKIVNDPCLNFHTSYLITGASRSTFDCSYRIYWQDKLNPDRTLDIQDVPWVQICTDDNGEDPGGCITCVDTDELDCDKILLESIIKQPCVKVERGPSGGTIFNGTYYVQIAYVIDSQRVTDYFAMSNFLSLFEHDNLNFSLDITIDNLDENFDEYELVLVQFIAEKLTAYKIGTYSTNQNQVTIDYVDPALPAVDVNKLPITNPIADKSGGIFNVGKYLFRTDVIGKFDFNYQPLANQIVTKWQVVEYPEDYYRDGGVNVGHMRDEVYSYFIRFVYNTGDKSNSYHIPGRGPLPYLTPDGYGTLNEDDLFLPVNSNNIENLQGGTPYVFEMYNTALGYNVNIPLPDGGVVTAEGLMGYWQSDEFYDDKNPDIWNSNILGRPELDLCGKRIRHHKFPENTLYSGGGVSSISNHYVDNQKKIRIMAVAFENILPPTDNDGNLISNITGYEILRGSRFGNKTVLYKGMINNMREYAIPDNVAVNRQGLYPNYPFNSLFPDPFTSTTETSYETIGGLKDYNPNPNYSKKHFTFHSPDTMFNKPFLSQKELKIYGALYGLAECNYRYPRKHPKHVFVTDASFILGVLFGIGLAIAKQVGKRNTKMKRPSYYSYDLVAGSSTTVPGLNAAGYAIWQGGDTSITAAETLNKNVNGLLSAAIGVDTVESTLNTAADIGAGLNVIPGTGVTWDGAEVYYEDKNQTPSVLRVLQAVPMFTTNLGEGTNLTLELIQNFSKVKQFALQYVAHCGYEYFGIPYNDNRRRLINEAVYLDSQLQNYGITHRINNIVRFKTVAFDTSADVTDLTGVLQDDTLKNMKASDLGNDNVFDTFNRRASSHYVAFKNRLRNQYGQLTGIRQLQATYCPINITETTTGPIFGGDVYIGRYQEKNTFFHFYQWLYDQPDRAEWNYHLYDTVQHQAFWMDTDPFDIGEFVNSIGQAITDAFTSGNPTDIFTSIVTPSDKHCFDRLNNTGFFTLKNVYMYLFHSSVRDFFVETELNIDHRDYGELLAQRHWAVLQDLPQMFDTEIIRAGNYYALDRSLSVAQHPATKLRWGKMQDRDYNPTKAETCYTEFPKRLLYSLPQQTELKKDNWSVFLANNYKDFSSKITAIKAIQRTGILLLFETDSPGIYPGVDELQLRSGTSVTVGDGGLFLRDMQALSNVDKEYQYGSCQSRRSVINTPAGVYYMSLDQGKIFGVAGSLTEISLKANSFWINQYLPYQLLLDFPTYDLIDNPVVGIGCQSIYDNEWAILYFCKKDFKVKPEWLSRIEYIGNGNFLVDGIAQVKTGDSRYFDNASWTMSFDPKSQNFISWHDWHPDLTIGATNTFLTTKNQTIWKHNVRCDLYCNYYNVDYPFELEFQIDNTPSITTIRNVEYYLQVFRFSDNCRDRYHVLDFNFDEAILYNSEQVSGLLKLNNAPKNNVLALMQYPIVGLNQIDIVYSKEEHKYRFNQFWDITKDRGEFTLAQNSIWITEPNGYIKNLNPVNLNYSKAEFQRKKLRHNNNRVILRRVVSGNNKMLMFLNNTKLQPSER